MRCCRCVGWEKKKFALAKDFKIFCARLRKLELNYFFFSTIDGAALNFPTFPPNSLKVFQTFSNLFFDFHEVKVPSGAPLAHLHSACVSNLNSNRIDGERVVFEVNGLSGSLAHPPRSRRLMMAVCTRVCFHISHRHGDLAVRYRCVARATADESSKERFFRVATRKA